MIFVIIVEAPLEPDTRRLDEFMGKALGDLGATISSALVVIGEKLGLYRALAEGGPMDSAELARRTGTAERYVREWLMNQAAGGYVTFDPPAGTWHLTPEQAAVLADETHPAYLPPAFQLATAMARDEPAIAAAFRSGRGVPWGEHDPGLFDGTERFFAIAYRTYLVGQWVPALDGVEAKLRRGARVADVGCGHGASTRILAEAFPRSQFLGVDSHSASIDRARDAAAQAGLSDRTRFLTAAATDDWGSGFDLVTFFDCLHDMGDPVGAARRALSALRSDGTVLLVEPFAHDAPEQNLNPAGRMFLGASTLVCVPASLAYGGPALGAQAGEARLRSVMTEAGFTRFRRAAETPFNLVLEARP